MLILRELTVHTYTNAKWGRSGNVENDEIVQIIAHLDKEMTSTPEKIAFFN